MDDVDDLYLAEREIARLRKAITDHIEDLKPHIGDGLGSGRGFQQEVWFWEDVLSGD